MAGTLTRDFPLGRTGSLGFCAAPSQLELFVLGGVPAAVRGQRREASAQRSTSGRASADELSWRRELLGELVLEAVARCVRPRRGARVGIPRHVSTRRGSRRAVLRTRGTAARDRAARALQDVLSRLRLALRSA